MLEGVQTRVCVQLPVLSMCGGAGVGGLGARAAIAAVHRLIKSQTVAVQFGCVAPPPGCRGWISCHRRLSCVISPHVLLLCSRTSLPSSRCGWREADESCSGAPGTADTLR